MAGEERPALAGSVKAPAPLPAKVLLIVVPVIVAGAAAFAFAVYRYAGTSPSASDLAQLLGLFASMARRHRAGLSPHSRE